MKKITCISVICLICVFSFIAPLASSGGVVYADVSWNESDLSKQVEGFKAYCKSRNLTIDGSSLDAVTSFTTQTYQSICSTLGINIDALQSEIKYRTDENIGLQWLFTSSGLSAYNRIFAEFLQNSNLEVGDDVNNKVVSSGKYFVDMDGISCTISIIKNHSENFYLQASISDLLNNGSPYKYTNSDMRELYDSGNTNLLFNVDSQHMNYNVNNIKSKNVYYFGNTNAQRIYYLFSTTGSNLTYHETSYTGNPSIIYLQDLDKYYFGLITDIVVAYPNDNSKPYEYTFNYATLFEITTNNQNLINYNVYLTTNNTTINQSTTINEGDTIIYNNDGSVYEDDTPPTYNPFPDGGGTVTGPEDSGGGSGADDTDVTFPDFNFKLPEIDWSIGNLSEKFPFSIPFDLIAFFTVLNADPEAPSIDAEIPLGTWYTWHFEADFSQFDDYAVIVRNVEFIAFVVGLIYLTIKLIKG